jgi:hypothetical protein
MCTTRTASGQQCPSANSPPGKRPPLRTDTGYPYSFQQTVEASTSAMRYAVARANHGIGGLALERAR